MTNTSGWILRIFLHVKVQVGTGTVTIKCILDGANDGTKWTKEWRHGWGGQPRDKKISAPIVVPGLQFSRCLASGPLYTFKNYQWPQRVSVDVYYIYWHVLFNKLKLRTIKSKNTQHRDFPGDPVVKSVFLMQGARVWSLVEELRSHMPHVETKNNNKKKRIPSTHSITWQSQYSLKPHCTLKEMRVKRAKNILIFSEK